MADIFISYAREDQALAKALASDFEGRGFAVWWDTELLGSDDYYEVILAALAEAKAAIVIWTRSSAKSGFVRDEARYALHKKKLVACRSPDLDVIEIPFGFQGQHTELVSERDRIVQAAEKLGARPAPRPVPKEPDPTEAEAAWEVAKTANSPEPLLAYLEAYKSSAHHAEAIERLRQVLSHGQPSKKGGATFTTGYLSAFLSGLTFRVPEFQLSTAGTISSIGLVVAFVALAAGALIAADPAYSALQEVGISDKLAAAIVCALLALLVMVGWRQSAAWIRQRSFAAGLIVALATSVLLGAVTLALIVNFAQQLENDLVPMGPIAAAVLFLLFTAIKIWRAR